MPVYKVIGKFCSAGTCAASVILVTLVSLSFCKEIKPLWVRSLSPDKENVRRAHDGTRIILLQSFYLDLSEDKLPRKPVQSLAFTLFMFFGLQYARGKSVPGSFCSEIIFPHSEF